MSMTEANTSKAFWDAPENEDKVNSTNRAYDAEQASSAEWTYTPREMREVSTKIDVFTSIIAVAMFGFVAVFPFSFITDTWHVFPYECFGELVAQEDGTFACNDYGVTLPEKYDATGQEILPLSEIIIGWAMLGLLLFVFVVVSWGIVTKREHLRHVGHENTLLYMVSRFNREPRIKRSVALKKYSYIRKYAEQRRDNDGNSYTQTSYEIKTRGERSFRLHSFPEEDYTSVSGLQIFTDRERDEYWR
jgi:hypothetical protein